ncbi:MAG: dTDP-4-dehydrorhamnose reductase [Fulvivirga sp.]|nr:dTDP-4-dehydrorhamnose reductase [Fulvivirga sp.]
MKILVTGAQGQLGSEINLISGNHNHDFIFIDRDELDLTSKDNIIPFLNELQPDLIINCAAYTAVDKAEDEPKLAAMINEIAPEKIATFCAENNKRLIHISTDYVFDGNFNTPIKPEDTPCPQSVYGETKLNGEKAVLGILDDAYIIRTSWVFSSFASNFVKTMIRLGKEKPELNVVNDQIGSPTYARDLAQAILKIIDEINRGNDQPGIYHYSNEGVSSWYDFAKEIMSMTKLDCKVKPIPTASFPTKAKRPAYSVLDKSDIKDNFEIEIPHWNNSLARCLETLNELK